MLAAGISPPGRTGFFQHSSRSQVSTTSFEMLQIRSTNAPVSLKLTNFLCSSVKHFLQAWWHDRFSERLVGAHCLSGWCPSVWPDLSPGKLLLFGENCPVIWIPVYFQATENQREEMLSPWKILMIKCFCVFRLLLCRFILMNIL